MRTHIQEQRLVLILVTIFKVDEIGLGVDSASNHIVLKGKNELIFGKKSEFLGLIICLEKKWLSEIRSLTTSKVQEETEFLANLYRISDVHVERILIKPFFKSREELAKYEKKRKARAIQMPARRQPIGHIARAADLKFSNRYSLRNVLPLSALFHILVCRGLGHDVEICCDQDLRRVQEQLLNYWKEKQKTKFTKIKDIEIGHIPEINIDEQNYDGLTFECLNVKKTAITTIPESIVFKKGDKKIGFPFPLYKATFDMLKQNYAPDHFQGILRFFGVEDIAYNIPENPYWITDSVGITDKILKKRKVEVESIYLDGGSIRSRKKDMLVYNIQTAKIALKRKRERLITRTPGYFGLALGFLNPNAEILLRKSTQYII